MGAIPRKSSTLTDLSIFCSEHKAKLRGYTSRRPEVMVLARMVSTTFSYAGSLASSAKSGSLQKERGIYDSHK